LEATVVTADETSAGVDVVHEQFIEMRPA